MPLLVTLKAVDPAEYPFYGTVVLLTGADLRTALTDDTVVVDDNLLVRLRAKVGDQLKIGGRWFRIAAVIEKEPDRMTAGVGLGPRVMMTRRAMDETELLQPGSRATERYLFALGDKLKVADVRAQIEKILPDAQVTDFRETSPTLTQGVDRATGLLSLICLVAMVLGAIGVAMAMRAHLQQRIEILAIMKSIGARSADILRIYLLQTLLLGVGGALIGVVLGLGVEYAFPTVLGRLLPLRPEIRLPLNPVLAALGTGILTTLLFCLPPLLDVRNVRPSLVLRRMVESGDGAGWIGWLKEHKLQLGSVVVILAGLGGIAAALSDSMLVGKWFAICLAGLLVFILGLSAATLRALRAFLSRTRLHLHSALRHGLANLYRPGNQSAAVLAALGTGVMLILSVFLMQRSIVNALHEDVKPDTPNLFLIDMSTQELPGIRAELAKQAGVIGGLEAVPIVSARVESIDGTAVDDLQIKNYPKRLLRTVTLSWADGAPEGTKVAEGKWWAGDGGSGFAVVDRVAKRLNLKIGSQVTFVAGDKEIPVKVAAIYKIEGEHAFARSEFILPKALLADQPAVWYGDIHARPTAIPEIERALFATYPTVTVINIADILQTITRRSGSDHAGDPVSRGVFDSVGIGDSGVERGEHAVPADARGGGAEDAGCDAEPDRDGVQRGVCGAGAAGGRGGDAVRECAVADSAAPDGCGVPARCAGIADGGGGDGAAGGGDGMDRELQDSGAEAAGSFERGVKAGDRVQGIGYRKPGISEQSSVNRDQ